MSIPAAGVVQITTVPQTLYRLFPRLIEHLAARGFKVWAICSDGTWLSRETAAARLGIPVFGAPLARTVSPLADLRALWVIWRLLRRHRPRIAHMHTPKAGLLGSLAARLAGVPRVVYTVRGLPHLTARGPLRLALVLSESIACRLADEVMVVSHSVRDELLRVGACPADKMRVPGAGSAQGVDAAERFNPDRVVRLPNVRDELGIPADALVIGFIGRLVHDKGVNELLAAWRTLRTEYADAWLLVAGADREPRRGISDDQREALKGDSRVRLVGVVEDPERYYSAMDIFAFPSHREGFSNAVLEAAAMRLPVVGFDVVGVRDGVRHGETGLLGPPADTTVFISNLRRLLGDTAQRRRLGQAAREWMLAAFQPGERLAFVEDSYRRLQADEQ